MGYIRRIQKGIPSQIKTNPLEVFQNGNWLIEASLNIDVPLSTSTAKGYIS